MGIGLVPPRCWDPKFAGSSPLISFGWVAERLWPGKRASRYLLLPFRPPVVSLDARPARLVIIGSKERKRWVDGFVPVLFRLGNDGRERFPPEVPAAPAASDSPTTEDKRLS